ncbi:MAG: hypothetical protein ABT00_23780 [Bordetella sp. SCN 68-11]|nr:MAG: hypothetical protein ABT00_23780 [Bordetella sp. SCN 68-11]
MVVLSTAIMPARAPASMDMLQMVMRPSIDSARMVEPAYSMAWPVAPAAPIRPISASTMSLATTPGCSVPSTRTSMDFILRAISVCVASTCSTSEVPMPCARQAKAPCVLVWESPHTTVMPGSVAPCSGPTTCSMPWRRSCMPKKVRPKVRALSSSAPTCARENGSSMPWLRSVVGTLWSAIARQESARHGARPASRRPSKACGLDTSLIRCRSMYKRLVPSGSAAKACVSQSLS